MDEPNNLEFIIETQDKKTHILSLTPSNFKQQFKKFLEDNHICSREAFKIKTNLQYQLVKAVHSANSIEEGFDDRQPLSSPKFSNIDEQHFERVNLTNSKDFTRLENPKKQNHIEIESVFDDDQELEQAAVLTIQSFTIQQKQQKQSQTEKKTMNSQIKRIKKQQKKYTNWQRIAKQQNNHQLQSDKHKNQMKEKSYHNKFLTRRKKVQNREISPIKQILRLDSQPVFRRLYQSNTQSFSNKKNQQINPKQAQQYFYVQKYHLNDSLRRTNQQFFNRLHQHSTTSFNQKHYSSKESSEGPPDNTTEKQIKMKKQKSPKSGMHVIGQHVSSFKCEMKQILKQKEMKQKQIKQKEENIRRRIKERSTSPIQQKKQRKSRSCQKCSPPINQKETPDKKSLKNSKKSKPNTLKEVQSSPKSYFSNILSDTYNQFMRMMP